MDDDTFLAQFEACTRPVFTHIVHATMQAYGELLPVKTADAFRDTHPHLPYRSLIRIFHSPDGRTDLAAQETRFIEPDMCDLPRYRPRETDTAPR